MSITQPIIKKFEVEGLFPDINVSLKFKENVNIFVGENGLGKTTILNMLYSVLKCDLVALNSFKFESIKIEFNNNQRFEFHKEEFRVADFFSKKDFMRRYDMDNVNSNVFFDFLINNDIKIEKTEINRLMYEKEFRNEIIKYFSEKETNEFPISYFIQNLSDFTKFDNELIAKFRKINKIVKNEIIFLSTYRRIEKDINSLNISPKIKNELRKEDSLNFGMKDVTSELEKLSKSIKDNTLIAFGKMSSKLLEEFVDEAEMDSSFNIDKNKVEIVLSILEKEISKELNKKIIRKVEDKTINDNKFLSILIYNLIQTYENETSKMEKIEKFVNVCNKYLKPKKEMVFNKNQVEVSIVMSPSQRNISFEDLSSGEKQVISLFSKLYLESQTQRIILFDEPELSLSIEWQKQLLPDLMDSNNCDFLLAVTHSPFIFDNKFDSIARNLSDFIIDRGNRL